MGAHQNCRVIGIPRPRFTEPLLIHHMHFDADMLSQYFGKIWPTHVGAFTEFLITLRRCFQGDLDRMLIVAIVGSRTLPARRVAGLSLDDFESGQLHDSRSDRINIHSVADCTGIPRETVRRKVLELEKLGWVERSENGELAITTKAINDLHEGTKATFRYLTEISQACINASDA